MRGCSRGKKQSKDNTEHSELPRVNSGEREPGGRVALKAKLTTNGYGMNGSCVLDGYLKQDTY
jgi:hypothetical protein